MQYVDQIFDRIRMSKTGWKAAFCNAEEVQGYKQAMRDALIYSNVTSHDVVSNAIIKAIIEPNDFMPSVGKFVDWCKPERKHYVNYATALPSQEITKEDRDKYAKISKNILGLLK
jgi:hypothetical protein